MDLITQIAADPAFGAAFTTQAAASGIAAAVVAKTRAFGRRARRAAVRLLIAAGLVGAAAALFHLAAV